jgi:hypothetical protein
MVIISASRRLYPTLVEERPARFCDFSKLSIKITAKEKEQKIQQVSEGPKKTQQNMHEVGKCANGENGEGRQMKRYYMLL